MITVPLLLDVLANLLACAIYLSVARITAARPVEPGGMAARQSFAMWWNILGGFSLYAVVADAITMAGLWTVPLLVSATHVLLLVLLYAFAALFYYLIYLYTGKTHAWKPIFLAYGLLWAALVYWIESLGPNGIKPGPINPQLAYLHDPTGSPLSTLLGLLLLLPIIGAAVAYFTLFFRTREATPRYRIAVVSVSIVLWFSFSLVGSLAGVSQTLPWIIVSRAVSLLAAASVYAAYRPPAWVRRRWGIQRVERQAA